MVNENEKAPDFEAPDMNLKMVRLSDFKGKNVVLAFFPGAFTSVCTKEMCTFRDSMANFNKLNATVLGISVDAPFSLAEFAKQNNLKFDLISDSTREISRKYDVLYNSFLNIKNLQASKRSVFVLDRDGIIRYKWVSEDPGREPDYKKIEEVLSSLN
ncbi:peroxiredoxin [Picrophilus oshimae]|uniref:Peroxiredoxin n=1 Tax=Picrophilus torridus (strain ATCC 700027 / DSM 9790 / JCM 10055 / NBRC 100828 / KAW 2/3) TaxID=1122961 RepID=Q6KZL9_PICTO|nr:peroxiredoxin [Picrophilus oshimae]AAT43833.1 putative peroxiredoxin [Picrophilus oshimae DSM 9789]